LINSNIKYEGKNIKLKGIACNLRLAKLCSDINKPNGQFRLENDIQSIVGFIEKLPIRKMNGIGPSTSLLLECYGIHTCKVIENRNFI
jgi:DNA polymerase kappa